MIEIFLVAASLFSLSSASEQSCQGCPLVHRSVLVSQLDPKYAGGAKGVIKAVYNDVTNPMFARVSVKLDLSRLDVQAIKQKYPRCKYPQKEFAWHIHSKWNNNASSGFLDDCSAAQTGGHYDPTFACGPASQYANDQMCTLQQSDMHSYQCSADTFPDRAINCEMGDFSGKFGKLQMDSVEKIKMIRQDVFFPPKALFNQPRYNAPDIKWNFILHLSCPEHENPRVLCALSSLDD